MFKNKKLIVSLVFLALILIVSACGGGDDEESSGSDSASDNGSESTDSGSTAQGDAASGSKVFENNCLSCHGKEGAGGSGPTLQGDDFAADYDKVVKQVTNGGGGMPAFEGQISDQEIADVATYISEEIAPMGK